MDGLSSVEYRNCGDPGTMDEQISFNRSTTQDQMLSETGQSGQGHELARFAKPFILKDR
jgi:hypothetical protein